jgi:hypothetical protein
MPAVAGDIEAGLSIGYGFNMNPPTYIAGVDDSSGGLTFEARGHYKLLPNFLFGGDFSVGVLTGFMMVQRYTDSSGDYGRGDIPIVGYGQLSLGPIYAFAGLGFHLWTGDGKGSDLGMTYGGGYLYELSKSIALDAGLRLHTIFANNSLMLTVNVGAMYRF